MDIKNQTIFTFKYVARASLLVMLVFLLLLVSVNQAKAADLLSRQIILADSEPGKITTHTFEFINPSAATLGSIKFEYCGNSPLFNVACIPPAGLVVNSSSLATQSGNTGFVIDPLTNSTTLVLSRLPTGTLSVSNRYVFSNVTNPTALATTTYVRISLYASSDTSGASFDRGAIAFSTSGGLGVGAFVPPFLIFCVGVTVSSNCTSATGNLVSFGEFSPNTPSTATTQFSAATNDEQGLQVFITGQTMTSGNNVIPGLGIRTSSTPGVSQFGLNLRSNSVPSVGSNPSGNGSTSPASDYNTSNQFKFADGSLVASSSLPTDFVVFTVSYITNISEDQPPGVYASTLGYTAIASF